MKIVVDKIPSKPEKCLYQYKSMFGSSLCRHTKKRCELTEDEDGKSKCDRLMGLDDTLKEALRAYTKILDKKI